MIQGEANILQKEILLCTKKHHDHLNKIVFKDNRLLMLSAYLKGRLFTSKYEVQNNIVVLVHISFEKAKKTPKINEWPFANIRFKTWNMNFKLILLLSQCHRYSDCN